MDNTEPKKLYRSAKDRMISGVCGGMADYFNIDPTIVRIIWVLLFFTGGAGLLLYIAALIIVPLDPDSVPVKRESAGDSKAVWGIILVVIGIILLIGRYGWCFSPWGFGAGWHIVGPILLILAGLALIFTLGRTVKTEAEDKETSAKRLYRISEGRMFLGIAGGCGEYFNIDPTIARLFWAIFIIVSGGLGLLVYFVLYFILPEKKTIISKEEEKNGQT